MISSLLMAPAPCALVLQQQTGRQVFNEARLGRKVLYLQPKALHGEEPVATNRTVFDLPQLQGQAGSKAFWALQSRLG